MGELILLNKTKRKKKIKTINIGVIVQARMTSKRFPGKSMATLLGKPVLERVLERVKTIPGVIPILAVPDTPESDPMLVLANDMGVDNFCGSELNVMQRFIGAAKFFKLDVIVRVTGDCPFIDPRVCREVLDLLLYRNCDYTSNIFPNRTFPRGLDCEAFTFDCLEAAQYYARGPYDLEHVTPWMQETEDVRKGNVEQRIDMSMQNWCVDYPEDIIRLEELAGPKGPSI